MTGKGKYALERVDVRVRGKTRIERLDTEIVR